MALLAVVRLAAANRKSAIIPGWKGRPRGDGAGPERQCRIVATNGETLAAMLPQMTKPKCFSMKYA
jgi:hypothetical protein